ncbi:MAG: LicD family protein [Lachnospiraceae bacterium]|nr:LicD family protein [Lachnospiraceae bacterium]
MSGNFLKPGKTVYSEWFREYRLSDTELKQLQNCLLGIFADIRELCDEHGIGYMMCGGTLLGTVRHKGFIPWDDDIDIMMLRSDFEKFVQVLQKEQRAGRYTDYELAVPCVSEGYYFKIPKLYAKNTEYRSVSYMGNPGYNMVAVDIFVVEPVPQNHLRRLLRGLIYDLAFYASAFCLDYLHPSPVIMEKCGSNREIRRYYRFRRNVGCIFSHIGGIRLYLKICDRLGRYSGRSAYMGTPADISYRQGIFPKELFTETARGEFCGLSVIIPKDYDSYLRDQYGDYMTEPPEHEREIHVAYSMDVAKALREPEPDVQ